MSQIAAGDHGSHVIDIDLDVNVDRTAALRQQTHDECAVCMERLMWAAVWPCGHREVCSKCAVRIRSVDGNRLCCICRTRCPAVLVVRRSMADDVYTKVSSQLAAAAADDDDEGRVGDYWYHQASAAYFDDERQYDAAKRLCSELERAKVGDDGTRATTPKDGQRCFS